MWLYLPFHGMMLLLSGLFQLLPHRGFLPLPAAVNEAIGYLGGIALWALSLPGEAFSSALWAAFIFLISVEIAVITTRAILRALVMGIGVRFGMAFLSKHIGNLRS